MMFIGKSVLDKVHVLGHFDIDERYELPGDEMGQWRLDFIIQQIEGWLRNVYW